jgi:hypothetical protein
VTLAAYLSRERRGRMRKSRFTEEQIIGILKAVVKALQ